MVGDVPNYLPIPQLWAYVRARLLDGLVLIMIRIADVNLFAFYRFGSSLVDLGGDRPPSLVVGGSYDRVLLIRRRNGRSIPWVWA